MIKTNVYQTELTEELLETLPKEVQEQLFDFINNVPFIQNLISPNRKYAKDLKRDDKGRIIIDLCNPHILEDMDYFRPSAIYFKKHGVYTHLRPNANPNSEYGKWIRQERDRCWDGMIRESDGEWVTGPMYFYLNYMPILQTKVKKGTKQANRVEDFPQVWEGIYWRYHYKYQARYGGLYNNFLGGNHGAELASRGKSKSYSGASDLTHNFVLGEDKVSYKNTTSLVTAYQKEYLTKDGILNKFIIGADFCATNTQFPKERLKNSIQEMTWKMGFMNQELGTESGSLNTIIGVSSRDDESKLRGKRAVLILIEEFGTFPRLVPLYNNILESVQEGDYVFGFIYMQGTAGDSASDFMGAQEIMYNPKGYNMYNLPNVFDKVNGGKKDFVFFFPGYVNRKGCFNEDGVSDVIKALIEMLLRRFKVKYNSSDPETIVKTIAEVPITPAEAITKVGSNMFPTMDLTARLEQLDANPRSLDDIWTGELIIKDGEIKFKPSSNNPIREFPHKDNKLEGCIEIEVMPEKDRNGKVFSNRYILGADPYDDDQSDTLSLGGCHILDLWTDKKVAWYTGRPQFADDYYEICRRMCLFYNGQLNYENNKKGLFAYFSKMNSLYLLTDTLQFLKDKEMMKEGLFGNKAKGTIATGPINSYGLRCLRDYLLKPIQKIEVVDGEEVEVTIPLLYTIKERAFLKELISFNNEGNFDRISSHIMLMLLREDKLILYGGNPQSAKEVKDSDYLGNDDFFSKNYDEKFKKNINKFN